MWGLPQKQNARRAYKIRLCGHLRRYKKIVKKTYIILLNNNPILDNPFYSYQYENRLTQLYNITSEVAYEICMSVILHNMKINCIKNQLQLFDDIETENV